MAACVVAISAMFFEPGLSEEPVVPTGQAHSTQPSEKSRPTVQEARRQAEILHTAISSTLQLVHDRYYQSDQGQPIPAAVLNEVFSEIEDSHAVKLRWLAVEGQAMNVDHKPKTPFEHAAFEALKSGKKSFEQTDDNTYRRASAIKLSNNCLKCHVPDRKNTKDRMAGLIMVIPINGSH